jgi:hypothetical protein
MTMDPAGNLYVANTFGNNVTVYALGTTTPFAKHLARRLATSGHHPRR